MTQQIKFYYSSFEEEKVLDKFPEIESEKIDDFKIYLELEDENKESIELIIRRTLLTIFPEYLLRGRAFHIGYPDDDTGAFWHVRSNEKGLVQSNIFIPLTPEIVREIKFFLGKDSFGRLRIKEHLKDNESMFNEIYRWATRISIYHELMHSFLADLWRVENINQLKSIEEFKLNGPTNSEFDNYLIQELKECLGNNMYCHNFQDILRTNNRNLIDALKRAPISEDEKFHVFRSRYIWCIEEVWIRLLETRAALSFKKITNLRQLNFLRYRTGKDVIDELLDYDYYLARIYFPDPEVIEILSTMELDSIKSIDRFMQDFLFPLAQPKVIMSEWSRAI